MFITNDRNGHYRMLFLTAHCRALYNDDDNDDIVMPPPDETTAIEDHTSEDMANANQPFPDAARLALTEQKINEEIANMSVAFFLFSVVWSLGATLDKQSRLKFDEFFRGIIETESQNCKYPR